MSAEPGQLRGMLGPTSAQRVARFMGAGAIRMGAWRRRVEPTGAGRLRMTGPRPAWGGAPGLAGPMRRAAEWSAETFCSRGEGHDAASDPSPGWLPYCSSLWQRAAESEPEGPPVYEAYPPMAIDPLRSYSITFTTSVGRITFQLFPDEAPLAVNNFIFLANSGYYDGVAFHRVVSGVLAETGRRHRNGHRQPGLHLRGGAVDSGPMNAAASPWPTTGRRTPTDRGSSSSSGDLAGSAEAPHEYTVFGHLKPNHAPSVATLDKIEAAQEEVIIRSLTATEGCLPERRSLPVLIDESSTRMAVARGLAGSMATAAECLADPGADGEKGAVRRAVMVGLASLIFVVAACGEPEPVGPPVFDAYPPMEVEVLRPYSVTFTTSVGRIRFVLCRRRRRCGQQLHLPNKPRLLRRRRVSSDCPRCARRIGRRDGHGHRATRATPSRSSRRSGPMNAAA